jgi:S1-C subfamily serine protease
MQQTQTTSAIIKKHSHHKPYVLWHIAVLVLTGWVFFTSIFLVSLHFVAGPQQTAVLGSAAEIEQRLTTRQIVTPNGLSFEIDPFEFVLAAEGRDGDGEQYTVKQDDIENDSGLVRLSIHPLQRHLLASDAGAQLEISFASETEKISAGYGATKMELIKSEQESLGELLMQRSLYKYVTTINGQGFETYSIHWSGIVNDELVLIKIHGLNNTQPPVLYRRVLASLRMSNGEVLGADSTASVLGSDSSETKLDRQYVIDAVSPAVVKIYHITCGTVVVDGQEVSRDTCDASTGSGFLISSSGHIATNGHVVEYHAEDALISALLKNPEALPNFLRYIGLNDEQIAASAESPQLLAAVIAKIYDAPSDAVKFKDKQSVLIVALGARPLVLESEAEARTAVDWKDTDHLKKARLLASNYSAKDLFVVASDNETGFSSSDVAIIKVDASDTPYIKLFDGQVTQNQSISILGFPGDADNHLTDNHSLSPTVTNGSISAIRLAAGSSYRLYQSDADASAGNSGGPVIDNDGQTLGLLTYRFKSDKDIDAAKSYIRDINDIRRLAEEHDITLGGNSIAQAEWSKGLDHYSKDHYSKALAAFETVRRIYPAHRLASQYEQTAEDAIAAGRDVPDVPLWAIILASFGGATGAAWTTIMIARHHHAHRAYVVAKQSLSIHPQSHHKPTHYAST